jgi:hypothetical protein
MVESYIERFNAYVTDEKTVTLKQQNGSYLIETSDGGAVYTGLTLRESYMCVRGMLHAIGKL